MRLLTVGNKYPPLHDGGYELVWQDAVEYLRGRGHEVQVLTTDHRAGERIPAEPGVSRALRWYWRDHAFPRLGPIERLRLERHNAAVFDRLVRDFDPDVVGWWAMGGMSLGLIERVRRSRRPAVGAICDDWMLYGPGVDAWMRMFSRRPSLGALAERATGLPTRVDLAAFGPCLFPSETTRRRALERLPIAETRVCHQGVSSELFRSAPPRPWRWRLLSVGRLDPRKGVDLAVRAVAELPGEARLTVAGEGDDAYRAELVELAASLGISDRVTFTSRRRSELSELYADADAVLFPVRWEEPWGLVPLEAMAVGRPVVASGLGGSGEYLSDGENCLLTSPDGAPSVLADRVRALAADASLRARLREGGFATTARFGADDFSRAFEEAAEQALAAGP